MKVAGARAPQARTDRITGAVRRLQDRCELEFKMPYGTENWTGPFSDLTIAMLLARVGVRWRYTPLNGLCELVWPAVCGIHVLQVDRCQTPAQKRFATRHGLAHILAGHVADVGYRHDGHDWHCDEETIADLFAMMDLVHREQIADRRAAGFDDEELHRWICWELARYADFWPLERIEDRAHLRLTIHRGPELA